MYLVYDTNDMFICIASEDTYEYFYQCGDKVYKIPDEVKYDYHLPLVLEKL